MTSDDITLMEESEEEIKNLLMKVKQESEKAGSKNEDHGIQSHHFMANRQGNNRNSDFFFFSWAPKSLQMVTAATKLKDIYSLKEKL